MGRYGARLDARIGAGYLFVRHPGLLNSIATALAKLLSLPAWLSITLFWSIVTMGALVLVVPVMRVVRVLAALLLTIARLATRRTPAWFQRLAGTSAA